MTLSTDDQLAIQHLYASYCHAVDDGDGDAFAACFTAEGALEAGPGEPVTGTAALAAFAPAIVKAVPGLRHVVTNIAVDGSGDDATGRAYLYAYRATDDGHQVVTTGRYRDALRRVDGRWRFVSRHVISD